jgi:pimeloyl-ACP methyl ester carboxylesterase
LESVDKAIAKIWDTPRKLPMESKKIIYCISGLGADERAFSKINVDGYQLKVIPWLIPLVNETLQQYATRMRSSIDVENPILMGLSFGGMVSIEIAKQIPVKKIILISSIKNKNELPSWMKLVAKLKLNKIFPLKSTKLTAPIQNKILGISTNDEKKLVYSLRKNANQVYINWAVNEAINWKNEQIPTQIFHLHGNADKMFPIKKINADIIINNGGHFMIMNKAAEISKHLQQIVNSN